MTNEIKLYENNGALASVNGDNYTVAVPGGTSVELIRSKKDQEGNDLADGDFGVIPGTSKPSLFKSGADKIRIAYGFFERHTIIESLSGYDPNKGCVKYVDRCELVKLNPATGQEYIFASYYGTANDMEKRNGKSAGSPTVDNTAIKMAQKRAMVGAVISVANLSNLFTMDMEDTNLNKAYGSIKQSVLQEKIGAQHIKKLWAEASSAGLSKDDVANLLISIGYESSKDVTKKDFGNVLDLITKRITFDEYKARRAEAGAEHGSAESEKEA